MPEASTYQCPNCGGVLAYSAEQGYLACEYCGHAFEEGELERGLPLGGAAARRGETIHARSVEDFLEQAPWQVGRDDYANAVAYSCPSCGARVRADQSTVSTACPYCGNNMLVQGIATEDSVPDWVMPFTLSRDQAEAFMRQHFMRKWYLSRKFNAQVKHMQGVYVPYHLFDLHVSGWANYIAHHEALESKGAKVVTYSAMRRAGYADIQMLPVDGSSKMPDGHMDSIAPFDFSKLREFSAEYLAGYLAEVADEDAQTCLPRAKKRVKSDFERRLADEAKSNPKVDDLDVTSHATDIQVVDARTCLLPVWLMHCAWEGNQMLFAVNGDTGKCVGDLPIDRTRRIATLVVGFIISFAVSLPLLMAIFTEPDMPDFTFVIYLIILLSPLAVDAHFKSQMNTALEAEGDGMAFSTTGLQITESWDGPKFHLNRDKAVADLRARPRE